jgi:hypothetical protein
MRARATTGVRPGNNSIKSLGVVAAFVVNSEPHTGASFSVRLCVGPELASCGHLYSTLPGLSSALYKYCWLNSVYSALPNSIRQNMVRYLELNKKKALKVLVCVCVFLCYSIC